MSEDKQIENDPERTLLTLDQLSQTIEVMTSVVNRLRQHLSEQLNKQKEEIGEELRDKLLASQATKQLDSNQEQTDKQADPSPQNPTTEALSSKKKQSFVVEINQQDIGPPRKSGKILH